MLLNSLVDCMASIPNVHIELHGLANKKDLKKKHVSGTIIQVIAAGFLTLATVPKVSCVPDGEDTKHDAHIVVAHATILPHSAIISDNNRWTSTDCFTN